MHTWHFIFLGSYLAFLLVGFGVCRDLHYKPKFFENGFHMENLLHFRVGNIIGLSPRRVPHLPMCVNLTPFMVLNIFNKIGLMSFEAFMKKL